MQAWHLISVVMRARDEDVADLVLEGEDRQRWACRRVLENGLAFTVLNSSGAPVACFGFVDESKGVCMAWLIATPQWCPYVKSVARCFKLVARDEGYRRIHAIVQPQRAGAERFLKFLGFNRDGTMPKIRADGSSMDLYSYT